LQTVAYAEFYLEDILYFQEGLTIIIGIRLLDLFL